MTITQVIYTGKLPGKSAVPAMTLSEEQLAFVLQEGMVPQQQVNTCVKGVVGIDVPVVIQVS